MKFYIFVMTSLFTIVSNAVVSSKVITGSIANSCFVQGEIVDTDRTFDIGIGGEGWIPLQDASGKIVYSRYGALGMNDEGLLVHVPSSLPVVSIESDGNVQQIDLAQHASRPFFGHKDGRQAKLIHMFFSEEGVLEGIYNDGKSTHISKLTLAAFENPSKLALIDSQKHIFSASPAAGEVAYGYATTAPFGKIFARSLEEVPIERYSKKCD